MLITFYKNFNSRIEKEEKNINAVFRKSRNILLKILIIIEVYLEKMIKKNHLWGRV